MRRGIKYQNMGASSNSFGRAPPQISELQRGSSKIQDMKGQTPAIKISLVNYRKLKIPFFQNFVVNAREQKSRISPIRFLRELDLSYLGLIPFEEPRACKTPFWTEIFHVLVKI